MKKTIWSCDSCGKVYAVKDIVRTLIVCDAPVGELTDSDFKQMKESRLDKHSVMFAADGKGWMGALTIYGQTYDWFDICPECMLKMKKLLREFFESGE